MTMRTEIREKILSHGLNVASMQGLNAVTVSELARDLHVPRSGLSTMFSSKEQLQLAILDQAAESFLKTVVTPTQKLAAGKDRIAALFGNWIVWARSDELKGGCPFVSASSHAGQLDPAIRKRLDEVMALWREELRGAIDDARAINARASGNKALNDKAPGSKDLRPDLDTEQFIFELFGLYLSHHFWHWSMRDRDAEWRTLKAFDRLLAGASAGKSG